MPNLAGVDDFCSKNKNQVHPYFLSVFENLVKSTFSWFLRILLTWHWNYLLVSNNSSFIICLASLAGCRNHWGCCLCWMRNQHFLMPQTLLLRTSSSNILTLILASEEKGARLSLFVTMQERLELVTYPLLCSHWSFYYHLSTLCPFLWWSGGVWHIRFSREEQRFVAHGLNSVPCQMQIVYTTNVCIQDACSIW